MHCRCVSKRPASGPARECQPRQANVIALVLTDSPVPLGANRPAQLRAKLDSVISGRPEPGLANGDPAISGGATPRESLHSGCASVCPGAGGDSVTDAQHGPSSTGVPAFSAAIFPRSCTFAKSYDT